MKKNNKLKIKTIKKLLKFLKPYKFKLLSALIATFIVSGTTGAIAYIVEPVMNYIFINKEVKYLYTIPLAITLIFLIRGIFQFYVHCI